MKGGIREYHFSVLKKYLKSLPFTVRIGPPVEERPTNGIVRSSLLEGKRVFFHGPMLIQCAKHHNSWKNTMSADYTPFTGHSKDSIII